MSTEKICETCKFQSKINPSMCLAEACCCGDMWEPEETQSTENTQNLVSFGKGDCGVILSDFMKGVE